jgi:hypothetical protein
VLLFETENAPEMTMVTIQMNKQLNQRVDTISKTRIEPNTTKKASKKIKATSFIKLLLPKKKVIDTAPPKMPKIEPIMQKALPPEEITIKPDTSWKHRKLKILFKRVGQQTQTSRTQPTVVNEPNN